MWDIRRKGSIFTYKGHTEIIKDVKFSPDGKWVVTASGDNTVKVGRKVKRSIARIKSREHYSEASYQGLQSPLFRGHFLLSVYAKQRILES